MPPRVSVIIPAYNSASHLSEALTSIRHQSFRDLEVIVVNDGSTDETGEIAKSFAARDHRFRVINQDNRGVPQALNTAIGHSTGQYIARMDADDVSHRRRIALQVRYLDAHPAISVLGTAVRHFKPNTEWTVRHPISDGAARARLLFRPPLCHPAVCMRASVLKERGMIYDSAFWCCEDFKLWSDISPFARFANLRQPLYRYRMHDGMITVRNREAQESQAVLVCRDQLGRLGMSATEEELRLHRSIAFSTPFRDTEHLHQVLGWIDRLTEANRVAGHVPTSDLSRYLAFLWTGALINGSSNVRRPEQYQSAPLFWRDLPASERLMRRMKAYIERFLAELKR